ncbi:FAD-binding oxidoreductase [Microbacterium xylanilyticum]
MISTIASAPVDDDGVLLHAEDAVAQTCLAVRRLEEQLATRGIPATDLRAVRLLLPAAVTAGDIVGIVAEELCRLHAAATIEVVRAAPDPPGALIGLLAEIVADHRTPSGSDPAVAPASKGIIMTIPATDISALMALRCVLLPWDDGFAEAARPWNLAARQEPAAVAIPESIADVQRVVRIAAELRLRVVPQSTGHLATALGDVDLASTVLLRLHALTGVTVDPVARTARVLGGTLWQDVIAAAAPHGLTAMHGSAGDVAVAGYVLSGGLSFYAREHGLAHSTVRAFEVVTASGLLVRASATEHPDLFWALRGGGGNFGAVVAIELDLLPIPDICAGMLLWDLDRAPEVLPAWIAWTKTAPESATTNLRLMRFPEMPELPPFLSGRRLVVIDGAVHEDDETAAALLGPLRALAPEMDTFTRIPAQDLLQVHMDPPMPTPAVSAHRLLRTIDDDAVDALLAAAGPTADIPLMFAELRHLGGALSRPADAALSHLPGDYAVLALQIAPTPELAELGRVTTSAVVEALSAWALPGAGYPNFAEHPTDAASMYENVAWERLIRVRGLYDPRRLWIAAHSVGGR